jgi:fructose-bisphosphate aldolase class II
MVDIINQFGGNMKKAYGVPVEEIQRGIKSGVRRSTSIPTTAWQLPVQFVNFLPEKPAEFDPRSYMTPARAAMKEVCKARMIAFGQAGWADKIKCITIFDMAANYKK